MISWLYEALDTIAKWCERNESSVRRIVGSVRRGWDEAEGDHKTVAEAWAEGGIDHGGFTKEEVEEEETRLERELKRRRRGKGKEDEPVLKGLCVGGMPPGSEDSLGVERPGAHCNHGNVPSVGDEVVTVGGEVLRANGNNDAFPSASPPRTHEGSPATIPTTCAVEGCGLTATMGGLCPAHFAAQEENTPGGKLHSQPRHPITELHRKLVGLGKLADRKPGPARTQLVRDSILLLDGASKWELQRLLARLLEVEKVSNTLRAIAAAAESLYPDAIRHTIICVLHSRSHIPELDEHWWPEQWYSDTHIDNGLEAFCHESGVFTTIEVEDQLRKQYPGRVMRPVSWKNAVDRWKRAGKLQPLGHNVYQPVEKEG